MQSEYWQIMKSTFSSFWLQKRPKVVMIPGDTHSPRIELWGMVDLQKNTASKHLISELAKFVWVTFDEFWQSSSSLIMNFIQQMYRTRLDQYKYSVKYYVLQRGKVVKKKMWYLRICTFSYTKCYMHCQFVQEISFRYKWDI